MKKTLIAAACALGLVFSAVNANATTLVIGDDHYVGSIRDGIPSSVADEARYITNLISLAAGTGDTEIENPAPHAGTYETYNREGSSVAGPLPAAHVTDAVKVDTSNWDDIDVTGFTYILAKYDAGNAGSIVFMVSGLTTVDLPMTYNGYGLSHYTLFNLTTVPDGGATLALLGCALVGLGALRRKFGV